MARKYLHTGRNHTALRRKLPIIAALSGALCALLTAGCTRTVRKSSLRDLQAPVPVLRQMQVKYSFIFIGSSGKKYPISMTAELNVSENQREGSWTSVIDSDGGLVAATGESKTIKPDKNLLLKAAPPAAAGTSTDPTLLVLNAGNPELGRGVSLSLQRVIANGAATWKAIGLSYFGYDAQIEDSNATPTTAAVK